MSLRVAVLSVAIAVASVCPAPAGDFEKYLPADTSGVVTIDVAQVVASKPFDKHLRKPAEGLLGHEKVAPVLKLAGVDPLKDVTRVTFAFAPSLMQSEVLPGGVAITKGGFHIVVNGRFDAKKVHTLVEKLAADGIGIEGHKIAGRLMYEFSLNLGLGRLGQGDQVFAVVADPSTVVLTSLRPLAEDALKIAAEKDASVPKDVRPLVAALDAKSSVAWAFSSQMATSHSTSTTQIGGQPPVIKLTRRTFGDDGITSVAGGLTVGDKLTLAVRIKVARPEATKALLEALQRGQETLGKEFGRMAEMEKGLVPVLEAIKGVTFGAVENDVTVSGELDADAIGVIFPLLTQR